jgi:predicted enzyme related to lactoylglutathione lyase
MAIVDMFTEVLGGINVEKEIKLGNVMIDCSNQLELRDFYSALLEWEKCEMYNLPAVRSSNGIVFLFCQEEDYTPPIWPEINGCQQKQMHFDFGVQDLAQMVHRAEDLGAVKSASQFGGDDFVTMIDPAGHPFCLCLEE